MPPTGLVPVTIPYFRPCTLRNLFYLFILKASAPGSSPRLPTGALPLDLLGDSCRQIHWPPCKNVCHWLQLWHSVGTHIALQYFMCYSIGYTGYSYCVHRAWGAQPPKIPDFGMNWIRHTISISISFQNASKCTISTFSAEINNRKSCRKMRFSSSK